MIEAKGWKWDILADHFRSEPELLAQYDYFWLPDDDIDASAEAISLMFELAARHALEVCQPALTLDSYFSHSHTLRCASFLLRYSSFVEVMAPCLSRGAVERSQPYWSSSPSGYGLDLIWSRLELDNLGKSAILDAIAVRHTRPPGASMRPGMLAAGFDPDADWKRLMRRFDLLPVTPQFFCYAGISSDGLYRGRFATLWRMFKDRLVRPDSLKTTSRFSRFVRKSFEHALKPAQLRQIFDRGGEVGTPAEKGLPDAAAKH